MEITGAQVNFASGVVGKHSKARTDRPFYHSGVEVGQNFLAHLHGPAEYRRGFRYVGKTRHNKFAVLYPFIFNDQISYTLEFTDLAIRVIKDDGLVLEDAMTITGITTANPGVVTAVAHGYSNDDEVYVSGVVGMAQVNGQIYRVANKTTDSFELNTPEGTAVDTSAYTTYSSGGTSERVYTIVSPYIESDLRQLKFAQRPEVQYWAHNAYAPRKLISTADTTWSMSSYTRINDPFGSESEMPGAVGLYGGRLWFGSSLNAPDRFWGSRGPDASSTLDATLSAITVGTSRTVTADDYGAFSKGDVGKVLRDSTGGKATITAYTSSKVVTVSITTAFVDTALTAGDWYLEDSTGELHYDDFTVGTKANDAVVFTLASQNDTADQIRFFRGNPKFMAIGTFGGMYKAYGSAEGSAIKPTEINVHPIDDYGCADLPALFTGNQIAFIERGGKKLRSFEYNFYEDTYKAEDKNVLFGDLEKGTILQASYTSGTPEVVWVVRSDGVLLSCTLKSTEDVAAWMTHTLGGDGLVQSVCGIPRVDNNDRLWVVVKRGTTYSLEYMTDDPEIPDPLDFYTGDANFTADDSRYSAMLFETQRRICRLDSSLVFDGTQTIGLTIDVSAKTATAASALFAATDIGRYIRVKHATGAETGVAKITAYTSSTVVSIDIKQTFTDLTLASGEWYLSTNVIGGLWHLTGQTVTVLGDGGVIKDLTVSGQYLTLPYQVFYAIVGYGYRGILRTLPIEPQLSIPVGGKEKTVNKIVIKLLDSLGVKYSTKDHAEYKTVQPAFFTEGVDYYDRPPRLFSGQKDVPEIGSTRKEKRVTIVQDDPLPCFIQGIIPFMEVELGGG